MVKESIIKASDGTGIYLKRDIVAKPMKERAVIILFHGITANQNIHYSYFTERMNAQGYTIYRYDHRGHGQSEGMRNYLNEWQEIIEDAKMIVELAKEENPGKKVYVLGHSLGGGVATHLGMCYPNLVDGYVICSPFSYYTNHCFGDMPKAGEKEDNLGFITQHAELSCLDEDYAVRFGSQKDLCVDMRVGMANSLYEASQRLQNPEYTAKFTDPVFMIHGVNDPFITVGDVARLFQEISSQDKELTIYSKVNHEIFNDPIKEDVTDDILRWLNKEINETLSYYK